MKTYLTIFIFRYTYLFENKLIAIQQLQKCNFNTTDRQSMAKTTNLSKFNGTAILQSDVQGY